MERGIVYIKKIELENIRCFEGKVEVCLSPGMNYFVGENNAGKSTFLFGLDFLVNSTRDTSKIFTSGTEYSSVTIDLVAENWDEILENQSIKAKKSAFLERIFDDEAGDQVLRLSRRSGKFPDETEDEYDYKKLMVWNEEMNVYDNPSGIDKPLKSLLDVTIIHADDVPADHADMAATKTLGRLINDRVSNLFQGDKWKKFKDAHEEFFGNEGEGEFRNVLSILEKSLGRILSEQYGSEAAVEFAFELPKAGDFMKNGDVYISDGKNDSVVLACKGTGMQRSFMLALLQEYSGVSSNSESADNSSSLESSSIFGVDEAETWLHPRAQMSLEVSLSAISETQQVILVTHSPYLLKNINGRDNNTVITVTKDNGSSKIEEIESLNKFGLPYVSFNCINYHIFKVPNPEYLDELYGQFQVVCCAGAAREKDIKNKMKEIMENIEKDGYVNNNWLKKKWIRELSNNNVREEDVPVAIYIRNFIHHPENKRNEKYTDDELRRAIDELERVILYQLENPSGAESQAI
jgi:hypothetical protein